MTASLEFANRFVSDAIVLACPAGRGLFYRYLAVYGHEALGDQQTL